MRFGVKVRIVRPAPTEILVSPWDVYALASEHWLGRESAQKPNMSVPGTSKALAEISKEYRQPADTPLGMLSFRQANQELVRMAFAN